MKDFTSAAVLAVAGLLLGLAGCVSTTYEEEEVTALEATAPAPVPSAGAGEAVNEAVLPKGDELVILSVNCFVRNWAVLGPFAFDPEKCAGEECQESIDIEFVANEGSLRPAMGRKVKEKEWKKYALDFTFNPEYIDLDAFYGQPEHCGVYAVAAKKVSLNSGMT